MKKTLFISFILLTSFSYSQSSFTFGGANQFADGKGSCEIDSTIALPVKDTVNPYSVFPNVRKVGRMTIKPQDMRMYVYDGLKWRPVNSFTSSLESKLTGISPGATVNQTDAYLTSRSNHTGVQSYTTVTGLQPVSWTGQFSDLIGAPDMSEFMRFVDTIPSKIMTSYAAQVAIDSLDTKINTKLSAETDPIWISDSAVFAKKGYVFSRTQSDARYLQSYSETDPLVPSYSKSLTSFSVIKTSADLVYEPIFSKNSAFNKSFGSTSGTIAEGNDSRILNGQTAFGWGSHTGLYPLYNGTGATGTWAVSITGNSATSTKLFTARTINGQSFDGATNITIPGSAIAGIPNSSLTNSSVTINGSIVSLGGSTTVSSSPTVSAPVAGNSITMGTAFQPRSGGPCMVLVNGSLTGALGLNETVTVSISSTQSGTYTTISTDVLLIGLLGLTLDRSVASFPVPTGYWVKVTRSGTASTATYTRWDL